MVGETLGKSVRAVCEKCNTMCNTKCNTKCNTLTQKTFHTVLNLCHVGSKFVYYFLYTAFPWVVLKANEVQEPKEVQESKEVQEPKAAEGGEPKGGEPTTQCDASHMKTE